MTMVAHRSIDESQPAEEITSAVAGTEQRERMA